MEVHKLKQVDPFGQLHKLGKCELLQNLMVVASRYFLVCSDVVCTYA
jgi:hypothetical protein